MLQPPLEAGIRTWLANLNRAAERRKRVIICCGRPISMSGAAETKRRTNPSIEGTATGKPVSAAHVKR
jgi:hypothetical protein